LANHFVAFRNALKKAGYDTTQVRQDERRQSRVEETPYVAVMRRVVDGEMTIEEGGIEIKRLQTAGL
jgi:hypothetical protein